MDRAGIAMALALGSRPVGVSGAQEQVPHGTHVGRSATPGTIIRGGSRASGRPQVSTGTPFGCLHQTRRRKSI